MIGEKAVVFDNNPTETIETKSYCSIVRIKKDDF